MGEFEQSADAARAEIVRVGFDLLDRLLDVEDVVADLDHVVKAAVDGLADDLVLVGVAG